MATDDQKTSLNADAPLDINILKEVAKKDLVDALNSINGAKTLVLDASLAGPLGLVTEVSLLKVTPHNNARLSTPLKTETAPWRRQDVLARTGSTHLFDR